MISFASIAIGLVIGGTAGMLAAYTGKIIDTFANAIAFVIISFPPLLAILVIIAFWEPPTLLKLTHHLRGGVGPAAVRRAPRHVARLREP